MTTSETSDVSLTNVRTVGVPRERGQTSTNGEME